MYQLPAPIVPQREGQPKVKTNRLKRRYFEYLKEYGQLNVQSIEAEAKALFQDLTERSHRDESEQPGPCSNTRAKPFRNRTDADGDTDRTA